MLEKIWNAILEMFEDEDLQMEKVVNDWIILMRGG